MKQPMSLRRRHLMIAGFAGAAMPAGVFAGQCAGLARDGAFGDAHAADPLVVSGRIIDADCKAIPGALVESAPGARTTTDADGRFMLTLTVPRRRAVQVRVSHSAHPTRVAQLARFQRDEAGTWRTTVGLSLV